MNKSSTFFEGRERENGGSENTLSRDERDIYAGEKRTQEAVAIT